MGGAALWSGTNIYRFRRKPSASVATVKSTAGRMLSEHENVSSVSTKVTNFGIYIIYITYSTYI